MLVRTLSVRLRRCGAGVRGEVVAVAGTVAGREPGGVALPLLASQSSSWCGTQTVSPLVRAAAASAEALQDSRTRASRRRFFMERPMHSGRDRDYSAVHGSLQDGPGRGGFPGIMAP